MHFSVGYVERIFTMNLKGRDFLKLLDFTPEEILYLIDLAKDFNLTLNEDFLN